MCNTKLTVTAQGARGQATTFQEVANRGKRSLKRTTAQMLGLEVF